LVHPGVVGLDDDALAGASTLRTSTVESSVVRMSHLPGPPYVRSTGAQQTR